MPEIKKMNHVAIVVEDLDAALHFWQDQLGLKLDHVEDAPSQGSKLAFIPVGESEIEWLQPTDQETGLAKYLAKHGEGLHHICVEVDDIEAMLTHLKTKGVRLINEEPVEMPGRRMAFIHPRAASGVLVELYEVIG
jgi:methylmalonyl-CoA/ethylmalonyl-CoA epimerase